MRRPAKSIATAATARPKRSMDVAVKTALANGLEETFDLVHHGDKENIIKLIKLVGFGWVTGGVA